LPTKSILLALMIAALGLAGPDPKPKASSTKSQEITGCLDQRGDGYVLKSEKDMKDVTRLKGKAFSDDNFARYVGHTVTVSGTRDGELLLVTKIVNIANTCAP